MDIEKWGAYLCSPVFVWTGEHVPRLVSERGTGRECVCMSGASEHISHWGGHVRAGSVPAVQQGWHSASGPREVRAQQQRQAGGPGEPGHVHVSICIFTVFMAWETWAAAQCAVSWGRTSTQTPPVAPVRPPASRGRSARALSCTPPGPSAPLPRSQREPVAHLVRAPVSRFFYSVQRGLFKKENQFVKFILHSVI